MQVSLAQTDIIDTLANFNDGFISEQSQQTLHLNGVDSIVTFQKGNTIVLQIEHDPEMAYQMLVNKTLMSGARVNGLNFQTTFTLGVVKQYCDMNIFKDVSKLGYAKKIQILYKDRFGHTVIRHKISQNLCRTFS